MRLQIAMQFPIEKSRYLSSTVSFWVGFIYNARSNNVLANRSNAIRWIGASRCAARVNRLITAKRQRF
jgi:hypothetical protein